MHTHHFCRLSFQVWSSCLSDYYSVSRTSDSPPETRWTLAFPLCCLSCVQSDLRLTWDYPSLIWFAGRGAVSFSSFGCWHTSSGCCWSEFSSVSQQIRHHAVVTVVLNVLMTPELLMWIWREADSCFFKHQTDYITGNSQTCSLRRPNLNVL